MLSEFSVPAGRFEKTLLRNGLPAGPKLCNPLSLSILPFQNDGSADQGDCAAGDHNGGLPPVKDKCESNRIGLRNIIK